MKTLISFSTLLFIACLTACSTQTEIYFKDKEVKTSAVDILNNSGVNSVSDTTWHLIGAHVDNCDMYYRSVNGEIQIAHTVESHVHKVN